MRFRALYVTSGPKTATATIMRAGRPATPFNGMQIAGCRNITTKLPSDKSFIIRGTLLFHASFAPSKHKTLVEMEESKLKIERRGERKPSQGQADKAGYRGEGQLLNVAVELADPQQDDRDRNHVQRERNTMRSNCDADDRQSDY
jgi:hypothetical protein